MILKSTGGRRRISLGMKRCLANPWERICRQLQHKGDKISGAVKSITDFGVFVGLPGGIGLFGSPVRSCPGPDCCEEAVRKYKKAKKSKAVVLAIRTWTKHTHLLGYQTTGKAIRSATSSA